MKKDSSKNPGVQPLFRVLSLDGGGTKGFYTLGVLHGLETAAGGPLGRYFDLIVGTSVGAFTAGLLATQMSVNDIMDIYRREIPSFISNQTAKHRSRHLRDVCRKIFGDCALSSLRTPTGMVCTNWNRNKILVLRSYIEPAPAHLMLPEAVAASCSAYPLFESCWLDVEGQGKAELVDGGYCANNPTLVAILESILHFGETRSDLRVISVGGGNYPDAQPQGIRRLLKLVQGLGVLEKSMLINTAATEQIVPLVFPDVALIRFNDRFDHEGLSETIIEMSPKKYDRLIECGIASFANQEPGVRNLLEWPSP